MSQKEIEDKGETATSLRQLREECAQIYELSVEEKGLIQQLCEYLSEVQSFFKIAISIPTSPFAFKDRIDKAMLSSNGDVILTMKDGGLESRPLSSYDAAKVVSVVKEGAESLSEYAKDYREGLVDRITILERLTRELRKLQDMQKMQESIDVEADQYMTPEITSDNTEEDS